SFEAEHDPEQARRLSHGLIVHETNKRAAAKTQFEVDNQHIDRGAACEVDSNAPDCFLGERQRDKVILWIMERVALARENYKNALLDLKMGELVKKPDELHWMLGL